jgi:hypothetical protein
MESSIDHRYRLKVFECLLEKPVFIGSLTNPKWRLECPLCCAPGASLVWMERKNTFKFLCSSSRRQNCGVHAEFPILLKMWNLRLLPSICRSVRRRDQRVLGSIAPDSLMHFLKGFPERLRGGADPNPTPKSKTAPSDRQRDPEMVWTL